jgi:hypothetical protein
MKVDKMERKLVGVRATELGYPHYELKRGDQSRVQGEAVDVHTTPWLS